MRIAVQCFGITQRLAGASLLSLELNDAATVADALDRLGERYQALAPSLPRCACARGDQIILRETQLQDGDEIALLPPVAGG
ncbi:MAG: MoaD/ThiS family protein [Pseudomonadota bacterium]|nr:MoaD/ThiS family protein [Pseudomonadota bacterium]